MVTKVESISSEAIQTLRSQMRGGLLTPADPDYEQARKV